MPDGDLRIRRATPEDAPGIARVHLESSDDAYAPLAATWASASVEIRARSWRERLLEAPRDPLRRDYVAEHGAEIVGFVTVGTARRADFDCGLEVYVIHVLPSARGRGVGSRLWARACADTRGESQRAIFLETVGELRCCEFYEAHGGEVVARTPGVLQGGDVTDVVYRWAQGQSHAKAPYALRPARADDFEFLFALKRSAHREHVIPTYGEWDEAYQRERYASRFDPADAKIVVVGGERRGELVVAWDEDPVFLAAVELVPEARGRGIGTAVIRDVLAAAQREGKDVRLQVFKTNVRARRLYEELGFRFTDETEHHHQLLWAPSQTA